MERYELSEKQLNRIASTLKEFGPCPVLGLSERAKLTRHLPPRADFPIPELVLFTLRDLLGLQWSGTDEKERWSIYAIFRETIIVFAMAKFGFELEFAGDESDLMESLEKLKKAIRYAEEGLREYSSHQLQQGNVTIANRVDYFEARYRYFRAKADEAYSLAEEDRSKARQKQGVWIGGIAPKNVGVTQAGIRRDQEGTFCSAAMMDAYFSLLEHKLTLLAAFIDFDPSNGALARFLGDRWGPKFKRVFDVAKDQPAARLFQKLFEVKERWRNPLAHGGYEKEWSSVYFHLPDVGPIPGSSSAFRKSAEFNLHTVRRSDHEMVCALFDEVDELFRSSHTKCADEYLRAGFDVAFDEENRSYVNSHFIAGEMASLIDYEDDLRGRNGDMDLDADHPARMRFVSQLLTKFWP